MQSQEVLQLVSSRSDIGSLGGRDWERPQEAVCADDPFKPRNNAQRRSYLKFGNASFHASGTP